MEDKVIYLLDKDRWSKDLVKTLNHKRLEEIVAEEDYDENYTIYKIDANDYNSVKEAIMAELSMTYEDALENNYVISFGF